MIRVRKNGGVIPCVGRMGHEAFLLFCLPSRAPLTEASGAQLSPGRRLSTPETRATAPPSASIGPKCLHA